MSQKKVFSRSITIGLAAVYIILVLVFAVLT